MADELGPEDFAALKDMLMSPDEATRKQAAGLSRKLTGSEQQAFFNYQRSQPQPDLNRREDANVVGGIPIIGGIAPEEAATAGLAAYGAAGGLISRGMAGLKSLGEQASPIVKYEVTHRALSAMGVPAPVAYGVAYAVSGYKRGAKAAPESAGPVSVEGYPRVGTTPAPEPPSPTPQHLDLSQRVPASSLTQQQIGERLAAVKAAGGPSNLPPQAVEALGRTRAARQAAAGEANAAPPVSSQPAAPVVAPEPAAPAPQPSQPAVKPMSRQQTLNELALAARRAKISLTGEDYGALQVAVRDGMTPVDAVAALAKARMSPIEQLAGSGSFAGLPSEADVAAAVAKRNSTGQWKTPTADAGARWRAAREKN